MLSNLLYFALACVTRMVFNKNKSLRNRNILEITMEGSFSSEQNVSSIGFHFLIFFNAFEYTLKSDVSAILVERGGFL